MLINNKLIHSLVGKGSCVQRLLLSPSSFTWRERVDKRYARNIKPWPVGPKEDWNKGIPNYEWRWKRSRKVAKVQLPDFDEGRAMEGMSHEQIRSKLKEKGVVPHRPWQEKPLAITSTGEVFEPYVPPEGDGRMSIISKEGAKDRVNLVTKKTRSMLAIRKIRSFLENFDLPDFAEEALQIYIKAHKALADRDDDALQEHTTDKAYPEMIFNTYLKTIRWQFIKSLETPRVVHVRCHDIIDKNNVFGQATVRFHTQQILAVYDRFGRLIHGSEAIVKDVLEYVVFENHLPNQYGKWRIHGKIIPDWMPRREAIKKTFKKPTIPEADEAEAKRKEKLKKDQEEEGNPVDGPDKEGGKGHGEHAAVV